MLKLESVETRYGAIRALKGVSLQVGAGEIVALLGANGAGKTTILNTISGLLKPSAGSIKFRDKPIAGRPAHKIVQMGICQSPEGRHIFPKLTVLENLDMGAFNAPKAYYQERMDKFFSLFPVMKERRRQMGGTLSGGEQQMLAIGRALMAGPKMLLLDEPSLGLAPILVETIFKIIKEINEQGTPVLLVEQNAFQSLKIAHRGYVLKTGEMVIEDTADALLNSDTIRKSYLGMS